MRRLSPDLVLVAGIFVFGFALVGVSLWATGYAEHEMGDYHGE